MDKNSNSTQVIWLAISSFSSFALAFISAAILSRYFNKGEYGTYKQVVYVYSTLQVIFTIGLPGVFSYFLPRYTLEQGKYLVNKINIVFLLLGLLFSVSLYFSSDFIAHTLKNEELSIGLKIFSVFPVFTLPTMGVEGIYTALRKTKYIAIYTTISRLLMLACIIIPVVIFDGDYISAIIGWGVAAFLNFLFAMYMKSRPYLNIRKQTIPKFYSTIFKYSIPLMGASLVGFFIHSSNQFFISRYYGTETFAEYSNGFISLPFIGMIAGSVKGILLPVFSRSQKEKKMNDALLSYRTAVDKSIILIYPLIFFCIAFASDIVVLIYGSQYSVSASYFRISLLRDVVDVLPFLAVLLATGHSKIYFRGHLMFALFLISLSYLFVEFSFRPIIIVCLFVFLEILMKIYFFYYIFKHENINLFPTITFQYIIKVAIHLSLVLILLLIFSENVLPRNIMPLLKISINMLLFYAIIILSQKVFRLNYLTPVLDIIKRSNA